MNFWKVFNIISLIGLVIVMALLWVTSGDSPPSGNAPQVQQPLNQTDNDLKSLKIN